MRMNRNSVFPTHNWPHKGLSLLEVVVSIALMGGILVSMLTAHTRLVRQSNRAALTHTAATLADDLLAEWFVTNTIPNNGAGEFPTDPRFRWSTSVVEFLNHSSISASVVNLRVFGDNRGTQELVFETELVVENQR